MNTDGKELCLGRGRPGVVAACILFSLLSIPARWGTLYLTRDGLRLAAAAGIMDESRGLGGQILGYNYFRHPLWVHWFVGAIAAGMTFGAVFAAGVLLVRRLNGGATLCGNCGTDVERAGGLVVVADGTLCCPVCRNAGEDGAASKENLWYLWWRLLTGMLSVGIAYTMLDRMLSWKIGMLVVDAGEAMGLEVPRVSGFMSMAGGPFAGSGWSSQMGNVLYGCMPIVAVATMAGAVGMGAYLLSGGPLGRTRVFGYRGPMRCGGCGYELVRLKTPRCPECGRRLGSAA